MSNHKLIEAVTKSQLRTDLPTFRTGDTLRVHVRIVEGSRERIQVFEGVVTVSYTHLTLPTICSV